MPVNSIKQVAIGLSLAILVVTLMAGWRIYVKVGNVFPFKAASIRNPSAKIMLVEESPETIDDSRWVPNANWISSRHSGRGDVTFTDEHVERETPQFGKDPMNSNPTF
jgi:hypothetical protein